MPFSYLVEIADNAIYQVYDEVPMSQMPICNLIHATLLKESPSFAPQRPNTT